MKAQLREGCLGYRLGLLGVGALGLVLGGCQQPDEGPYLQTEFYETKAGESERYLGGSCMGVSQESGFGGGTAPGATDSENLQIRYQYVYESTGDGVHFAFTNQGSGAKEERNYNAAFIASGERDEVVVQVGGDERRFVNWGTAECEPIREPDPEP